MKPTRRVVMFTPGLTEPGGAARRSLLLASELANRGWNVRVLTRAGTLNHFEIRRTPRLLALEVPGFDAPRLGAILFLLVATPLGLFWGLRAQAFIAIQITSQSTAAAICGLILRKPYVAFLTTGGNISEIQYVLARRTAGIRQWLLSRASAVVAQTESARTDITTSFPRARVKVAANPVMMVDPLPLDGQPKALFTGRFSEEKDLLRLLDVWRDIASEDPMARLTLVGAGGAYRSIEKEIRRKIRADEVLSQSVELPGWVDNVTTHLANNDLYVFPSLSEGMSNSLLEACAARRVIVATDIPANRAVLGDDYPLLYAAGDSDALRTALQRGLYERSVRAAAVAHIEQRLPLFSLARFVDQVERLIDRTCIHEPVIRC